MRMPRAKNAMLWAGIGALCLVGIATGLERAADVLASGALSGRAREGASLLDERIFEQMTALLDLVPGTAEYVRFREEAGAIAGKYNAYPVATLLHTISGALLLALAPLQFSATIRGRFTRLHRWSGRVLLVAAAVVGLSGIHFGFFAPYGGRAETAAAMLFGGFLLFAAGRAYACIRRRDLARHREWMIRMFAAALAIAVIRVISVALHGIARDAALFTPEVFGALLWIGWILTLGCAELWIRRTRARPRAPPVFLSPALEEKTYP
jgi:uncharacterized membrane protein